jgi:hypothetical protein
VVPADNPDAIQELLNIPDAEAERLVIDIWGPSRIRTLVRDPKYHAGHRDAALLRFWNHADPIPNAPPLRQSTQRTSRRITPLRGQRRVRHDHSLY